MCIQEALAWVEMKWSTPPAGEQEWLSSTRPHWSRPDKMNIWSVNRTIGLINAPTVHMTQYITLIMTDIPFTTAAHLSKHIYPC